MKSITHSLFLAATVAGIAVSTATADDSQLQSRLAIQQVQAARDSEKIPTIGVYAGDRGVGRRMGRDARDVRSESRFEVRATAHGQSCGVYVPAK